MKLLRFLPLFIITLLALPAVQAQPATATTDPVGFQSTSVPIGTTALSNPLVNEDTVRSSAVSNTASVVTLSSVSDVGSLLATDEPYYLEVISGPFEGERFDVNTQATKTAANSTVVVNVDSANNTSTLQGASLGDAVVVVRKHVTIDQLQGFFSPSLTGNNNSNAADQISLFDPASGNLITFFLRGDNSTWRQVGTTTAANKTIIPSGVGFFVTKRNLPTTYTSVGAVRMNDFAFPMPAGSTFRAAGFPVSYSPASLGGTAANAWTGSNNANLADQLQVFDSTSGTFTTYFLRGDGVTWRQTGTTATVTSDELFADNRPFMILRRQADQNYVLVNPITL